MGVQIIFKMVALVNSTIYISISFVHVIIIDAAVTDYLYYFDTSTLTFTRKFEIGEQKPGPRYSHSGKIYSNRIRVFLQLCTI